MNLQGRDLSWNEKNNKSPLCQACWGPEIWILCVSFCVKPCLCPSCRRHLVKGVFTVGCSIFVSDVSTTMLIKGIIAFLNLFGCSHQQCLTKLLSSSSLQNRKLSSCPKKKKLKKKASVLTEGRSCEHIISREPLVSTISWKWNRNSNWLKKKIISYPVPHSLCLWRDLFQITPSWN